MQSVIREYPDTNVSVHIVWESMLGSDDIMAARESSKLFDDPRVHQYWDPNRLSGISYSRDVFPSIRKDMISSLPADSSIRKILAGKKDAPPEKIPLWDVAFFYDAGAKWTSKPPLPKSWIKQLMYYGEDEEDGINGQFWKDDFKSPPIGTDWFVEISRGMKSITGINPMRSQKNQRGSNAADKIRLPKKCGTAPQKPSANQAAYAEITSLADSLDPLKEYFNANKDRHRFVTLLSPT